MDENYQTYLNRAMRLILPDTYRSQVHLIQESPKFRSHPDKGRQPNPFPGYTIITPPGPEDEGNAKLYEQLAQCQQQLVQKLGGNLFAAVPPESFHLTLADLIWDSAFQAALDEKPQFEMELQQCIAQIFDQSKPITDGKSIEFQPIGLMIMTRAIALCLAPIEENSYERILKFRRAVYQNRDLIGLGIEQQYYFTPHITLGYFGSIPPEDDLAQLAEIVANLSQEWLDNKHPDFVVQRAELCKFDDMTHYYREPNWATFDF